MPFLSDLKINYASLTPYINGDNTVYQLYDLKSLHDDQFRSEVKRRLNKIVDENSFIEGEYNKKFEEKFAEIQDSIFCRLVANGTDAIEIALKAFDIGHGDLVAIPGITFYATAEAVINVGATPILVDVNPETMVMCPESLERVIEQNDDMPPLSPFIFMESPVKWIKLIPFVVRKMSRLLKTLHKHLELSHL